MPTANSHPKSARGRRTGSGVNTYVIVLGATPFPPPHLRQNKVKFKIETNYLASAAPRPPEPGPRRRADPRLARSPAQTPVPDRTRPPPRPRPSTPPSARSPSPRGLPFPPQPPLLLRASLPPPPAPRARPARPRPPARTDPRLCYGAKLGCGSVSFTSWVTVQPCDVRST